jgi:hypothetical protein
VGLLNHNFSLHDGRLSLLGGFFLVLLQETFGEPDFQSFNFSQPEVHEVVDPVLARDLELLLNLAEWVRLELPKRLEEVAHLVIVHLDHSLKHIFF